MGTRGRTRSVCAREFVKQPMRWGAKALLVLFTVEVLAVLYLDSRGKTHGPRPMIAVDSARRKMMKVDGM